MLLWNFLIIQIILQVNLFTGYWSDNPDPENYLKKVACDPEKLRRKTAHEIKNHPEKGLWRSFPASKKGCTLHMKKILLASKDSPFNCMELDKDDIIHLRELFIFRRIYFFHLDLEFQLNLKTIFAFFVESWWGKLNNFTASLKLYATSKIPASTFCGNKIVRCDRKGVYYTSIPLTYVCYPNLLYTVCVCPTLLYNCC